MPETTNWTDLAMGLYDALTGRGAEISYDFDNVEFMVPSGTSPNATHAHWRVNGIIRIRTRDGR